VLETMRIVATLELLLLILEASFPTLMAKLPLYGKSLRRLALSFVCIFVVVELTNSAQMVAEHVSEWLVDA